MFQKNDDLNGYRRGSNPRGRSRAGHCTRVSILTPGWCLAVGAVVAAVIGLGDDLDRPGGGRQGRRVLGRCERPIHTIAFSPDDAQIATLEANGLMTLWKADGRGYRTIMGGDDLHIRCFAFDPEGDTVALGCLDGSIRFKDLQNGRDSGRFEGGGIPV